MEPEVVAEQVDHDDEVVATVGDEDEARPLVEALLLAGVGPALRARGDGVEVCVVAGDGPRARRALGRPDPQDPGGTERPEASGVAAGRPAAGVGTGAGTRARRQAAAVSSAGRSAARSVEGGPFGARFGVVRVVGVCLLALIVIPALAFFITFKAAGG